MIVNAIRGWSLSRLRLYSGATAEAVMKAFELLLSEKKVKSIFVNICGCR